MIWTEIYFYSCYRQAEEKVLPEDSCDSSEPHHSQQNDDEVSTESEDEDEINFPSRVSLAESVDKYLIFTTGTKTYSPHQIGNRHFWNDIIVFYSILFFGILFASSLFLVL